MFIPQFDNLILTGSLFRLDVHKVNECLGTPNLNQITLNQGLVVSEAEGYPKYAWLRTP